MSKKKIRPKFNSKMPDWGTTAFFFTRESDAEFKKQHPKAYGLLCFIGITVHFLPLFPAYRSPFNICCKASLVVLNSLNFCLSFTFDFSINIQ